MRVREGLGVRVKTKTTESQDNYMTGASHMGDLVCVQMFRQELKTE